MAHQKKTNPENLHQGEGIQVEEVTLETENIHHPAEEAVKVIFIFFLLLFLRRTMYYETTIKQIL